jgi:hypothetical protein
MAGTRIRRTGTPRRRFAATAISGRAGIARVIALVAAVVALILIAGIVLVLLKANPSNQIVSAIHDAAAWLAGPFDHMFSLSRRRVETAVNWGIAAVVWYAVGRLLARLVAR